MNGSSARGQNSPPEVCDVCGSTDIVEIRCKVICRNCGTILKSCADLACEADLP